MATDVTQSQFRAALLAADAPVPGGLTDGHGRPAGRRFDVYRNNVASSLIEALADSFPAIAKLLGDENFRNIAGVYFRQSPPSSPLMMYYGAAFPAFLAEFPPLAHLPYLSDVARLEQAQRESYHEADATPADASVLAGLAPEALAAATLSLAPALRLVTSDWPIHAIWAFNMVDGAPKPAGGAQNVLITRPEFDPILTPVDAGAATLISNLADGASLGTAHDAALAAFAEFDLSNTLGLLLSGHAITHIHPGDPTP